jgi:predicted ferric reductase
MKKKLLYSFFLINLGTIFFFWFRSSGVSLLTTPGVFFMDLGMLAGLLAAFSVLLQFFLMGRSQLIEKVFGLDKLAKIHHLNGYSTISFIILHPILLTMGYSMSSKNHLFDQFLLFLSSFDDVFNAFIALILFIVVVFSSIYIVRKKLKFEHWYWVHLMTYGAVVLAWGHQLKNGGDFVNNPIFVAYWYALYIFVFGNLLYFRFIIPFYRSFKHQFVVERVIKETDKATSVYITGKYLTDYKIDPGQFLILRFLQKGFYLESHPFSLSNMPIDGKLRVTIKNVGDYTQKIQLLQAGTRIFVEGPYGVFVSTSKTRKKILFIAGGIGITPIRSLLEQALRQKKDVILMYGNTYKKDVIFKQEIDALQKIFPFKVYYIFSQEPTYTGEKGRINEEKLHRLVRDIQNREIYFCGPKEMLHSMKICFSNMKIPSSHIHYEEFVL